jgi:mRNA export factor
MVAMCDFCRRRAYCAAGTFATCGSDGRFVFWDKDARNRLKEFTKTIQPLKNPTTNTSLPITSCGFNAEGTLYAYAHSYDWHQGHVGKTPPGTDRIMIHMVKPNEIQKKTTKR